jgi:hypothetical protein
MLNGLFGPIIKSNTHSTLSSTSSLSIPRFHAHHSFLLRHYCTTSGIFVGHIIVIVFESCSSCCRFSTLFVLYDILANVWNCLSCNIDLDTLSAQTQCTTRDVLSFLNPLDARAVVLVYQWRACGVRITAIFELPINRTEWPQGQQPGAFFLGLGQSIGFFDLDLHSGKRLSKTGVESRGERSCSQSLESDPNCVIDHWLLVPSSWTIP